ncbi:MAG: hypothetical protein SAMD01599839_16270 [Rectinema sp.]
MNEFKKLLHFARPYWKLAVFSLVMLVAMVGFDLAVPRLVGRIIDKGIRQKDLTVVMTTSAIMLCISMLSALVAVLNSISSIRVGENIARDLREAIFVKIQNFSYGNIDRFSTAKLMVRLMSDTAAVQRLFQMSLRIGTRAPLSMIGSIVLVVWLGGLQTIHGNLSLGQIIAFTNYLMATLQPLTMMTQLSNNWANGLASAKRINEVLDAEPEVAELPEYSERQAPENRVWSTSYPDFMTRAQAAYASIPRMYVP